jgi:hypothetical protein
MTDREYQEKKKARKLLDIKICPGERDSEALVNCNLCRAESSDRN